MPLPVDRLTKKTPISSIREAISATIEILIKEGKTVTQAAGQAFGMAREKTGKELKREA